jgi:hypothetical protein
MKAGAALILVELAAISSPSAPDKVQLVPPGHGNDRPRGMKLGSWINLEPTGQDRSDEANKSGLRMYAFTAHFWLSSVKHGLDDTADTVMDMVDALEDKLQHNVLGGWARHGIMVGQFDSATLEGGEDDDTTYVVRLPFVVQKQETVT